MDAKGKYFVKEGYKVAIGLYEPPAHCSTSLSKNWWKFLWALSIPPKVKIFWWRALNHIIPTSLNLVAHHVPVQNRARFVNLVSIPPAMPYIFFPVIKRCWKETDFWVLLKQVRLLDVFDVFIWMKDRLNREEFEYFAVRSFATWSERLELVHNSEKRSQGVNADWSTCSLVVRLQPC